MIVARPQFFMFEEHLAVWALALALLKAGNNKPARIAMIAMTTSSSMSVNPLRDFCWHASEFRVLLHNNKFFP